MLQRLFVLIGVYALACHTRSWQHRLNGHLITLAFIVTLTGCASTPATRAKHADGKVVCDTYIILSMCVGDLIGDGTVDMVYFSDTNEVFMYQEGRHSAVAEVMPFHRCAVPLNAGMQATTNRILKRDSLSLREELEITRQLIANYAAAKPTIDACNARFEDDASVEIAQESDFFMNDSGWDDD